MTFATAVMNKLRSAAKNSAPSEMPRLAGAGAITCQLGSALLALAVHMPAQAALISQTQFFDTSPLGGPTVLATVFGPQGSDESTSVGVDTLTFDRFDPALGTLQSASIQLVSSEAHSFGARAGCTGNQTACLSFGSGSVDSDHSARAELLIDLGGLILTHSPGAFTGSLGCSFVRSGFFGRTECMQSGSGGAAINRTFDISGDDLDNLLGPGTFDADFAAFALVDASFTCAVSDAADCASDASTRIDWSGRLAVNYTYAEFAAPPPLGAVPEPDTMLLSSAAFAAVLWARRRRGKEAAAVRRH